MVLMVNLVLLVDKVQRYKNNYNMAYITFIYFIIILERFFIIILLIQSVNMSKLFELNLMYAVILLIKGPYGAYGESGSIGKKGAKGLPGYPGYIRSIVSYFYLDLSSRDKCMLLGVYFLLVDSPWKVRQQRTWS